MPTTWREQLVNEMKAFGETWDDMVYHTMTDEQLDKPFYDSYGGTNGDPFTLWTHNRVYFPACYDGAEWIASVPRHPVQIATPHVGGG